MCILKISDKCFTVPDGLTQLIRTRTSNLDMFFDFSLEDIDGMMGEKSIRYLERLYGWLMREYDRINGYDDEVFLYAIHFIETIYPYAIYYKNSHWEFIEQPEMDIELDAMTQCMEIMDIEKLTLEQVVSDDRDCILSEEWMLLNQWEGGCFQSN